MTNEGPHPRYAHLRPIRCGYRRPCAGCGLEETDCRSASRATQKRGWRCSIASLGKCGARTSGKKVAASCRRVMVCARITRLCATAHTSARIQAFGQDVQYRL